MSKKLQGLYKEVRKMDNLSAAWNHIYSNGIKPDKSSKTRADIQDFKQHDIKHLQSLNGKLYRKTYKVPKARAVAPKKKKGDGIRPLVIADINTRIIQRSALKVLESKRFIIDCLQVPTSFGGIPKGIRKEEKVGVEGAIRLLLDAIADGGNYYIKSDIKDFFTSIPLPTIYEILKERIDDDEFHKLIQAITNLEVSNISDVDSKYHDLFDFDHNGTPQGCCLSSLFGNMLLYEFDVVTNAREATCIRFLDDFIIVAPTQALAWKAYNRGKKALRRHGLELYDPKSPKQDKASEGTIDSGVEFLGVDISGIYTQPSQKNCYNLLSAVDTIILSSKKGANSEENVRYFYDKSYLKTLYKISNKVEGWGNQYKFCNERKRFSRIDRLIDKRIREYTNHYHAKQRNVDNNDTSSKRRNLGVYMLSDCKQEPYWPNTKKVITKPDRMNETAYKTEANA